MRRSFLPLVAVARAINFRMTKFECAINYFCAIIPPAPACSNQSEQLFSFSLSLVSTPSASCQQPKIQPKNLKRPSWWSFACTKASQWITSRTERVSIWRSESIISMGCDGASTVHTHIYCWCWWYSAVAQFIVGGHKLPFFPGIVDAKSQSNKPPAATATMKESNWECQRERKQKQQLHLHAVIVVVVRRHHPWRLRSP